MNTILAQSINSSQENLPDFITIDGYQISIEDINDTEISLNRDEIFQNFTNLEEYDSSIQNSIIDDTDQFTITLTELLRNDLTKLTKKINEFQEELNDRLYELHEKIDERNYLSYLWSNERI